MRPVLGQYEPGPNRPNVGELVRKLIILALAPNPRTIGAGYRPFPRGTQVSLLNEEAALVKQPNEQQFRAFLKRSASFGSNSRAWKGPFTCCLFVLQKLKINLFWIPTGYKLCKIQKQDHLWKQICYDFIRSIDDPLFLIQRRDLYSPLWKVKGVLVVCLVWSSINYS